MNGACPLKNQHQAIHKCIQRSAECITAMIELDVDLNAPGMLLLHAACLQPCLKAVSELILHGADYHDKGALLMNACRGGDPIILDLLLGRREDNISEIRDDLGRTPLIVSTGYRDSVDMAKYLVKHGIDIDAKDRQGTAENAGCKDIVAYLRSIKANNSSNSSTSVVVQHLKTLLSATTASSSMFRITMR